MPRAPIHPPFELGDKRIAAGTSAVVELPVGTFITHEELHLRVHVVHGKKPGPTLLLTACIHGDEYNGAEIIRRVLNSPLLKKLRGTLIAVPIVNRPGFLRRSRYMADRRDLNRLFPGSPEGSLGGRLANVVTEELVPRCDAVIDLHTGAVNRANLPQIRITRDDVDSRALAAAFAPPAILETSLRPQSFRQTCHSLGKPILLYEAGEALRLDAASIRFGVQGVQRVMRHLKLLPAPSTKPKTSRAVVSTRSAWLRAPQGGLFTPLVALGRVVGPGTVLGFIADPYSDDSTEVIAEFEGLLIGRSNEAVADEGDGLFHIALIKKPDEAEGMISRTNDALDAITAEEEDHPVPYDELRDEPI